MELLDSGVRESSSALAGRIKKNLSATMAMDAAEVGCVEMAPEPEGATGTRGLPLPGSSFDKNCTLSLAPGVDRVKYDHLAYDQFDDLC